MGGLKTGPSRRHRIQPAEGPFLDPRAKETCFKKGSESGPLEIVQIRGPPVEWPPVLASPGFAQASASLEAPRLQCWHQSC